MVDGGKLAPDAEDAARDVAVFPGREPDVALPGGTLRTVRQLDAELWRSASMGETRAARKAGIHTLTSTVSAVRAMAKSTTRQSTIR